MGLFDFFKKKPAVAVSAPSENVSDKQFHSLSVAKIVHETPNAVSLYFDIPVELSNTFRYEAGQYVTLRYEVAGEIVLRSYSLSSCSDTDDFFRIGVKHKLGGKLSGILTQNVQVGDQLSVFPPLGNFTTANTQSAHYVLMAGGSGITPLLSILKQLLHHKHANVTMLYANRSLEQTMYAQELQSLQQNFGQRFRLFHLLDESPSEQWEGLSGLWQAADYATWLRQLSDVALSEADYFICGPTPMMQAAEAALKSHLSVPTERVHIEYFDMEHQSHSAVPVAMTNLKQTVVGKNMASIQLQGRQYEVVVPPNETLLTAALDAGLDAPFMCESGVCSSCRAKVLDGKVAMRVCYALSDREIAEGYVLTCQAVLETDSVQITYDI